MTITTNTSTTLGSPTVSPSTADVVRLQGYLQRFGYLTPPGVQRAPNRRSLEEPAAKQGVFDDNTQRALLKFQERHGLATNGELDAPTRALLNTPRCGVADTARFVAQGNKWSTNALRYGLQELTPDVSASSVRSAVAEALSYWSAVTPLTFTEVPISDGPEIRIRFIAGDHGDGSVFDGPGSVLAHGFYPPPNGGDLAGDTHFDEAENWSVDLPPSGIDLYTVAAHEFGHALGLDHSTIADSLMYPYYSGAHRHLHADDIAGIQSIYGVQEWRTAVVSRAYSTPHSMNAWAFLDGVGWRKIQPLSADGARNTFIMCCKARTSGRPITAQVTATEILTAHL